MAFKKIFTTIKEYHKNRKKLDKKHEEDTSKLSMDAHNTIDGLVKKLTLQEAIDAMIFNPKDYFNDFEYGQQILCIPTKHGDFILNLYDDSSLGCAFPFAIQVSFKGPKVQRLYQEFAGAIMALQYRPKRDYKK